jgi:pyridoxamine 5'-phosphate oxidase
VKIAQMSAVAPESDPIALYLRLAERARVEGIDTAPAALATADAAARPSVRIVLLRLVDPRGFVFFTNYESRKGRELIQNPRASLCQHWPSLEEQIRVEGPVQRVDAAESDAYFAGRPRESQLGAWASLQSSELEGRHVLEARLEELEQQYANQPVPRPPHWGGFRIVPERIEFWYGRAGRLHERLLYTRAGDAWQTTWLFP